MSEKTEIIADEELVPQDAPCAHTGADGQDAPCPDTDIARPLLAWYHENRRVLPWREDPIPYHVWLSEIMLQQTRVEAVRGYYDRFLAALPDIASLAAASEDQYLKLWEGLGYYSRVRNLHRAAQVLMEHYSGEMPADYDELRKLPGIGPYTAAAIASIAFGKPEPAIDGNLLRVFARLTFYEDNILAPAASRKARDYFSSCMHKALFEAGATTARRADPEHGAAAARDSNLSVSATAARDSIPGAFNQALMDLGALICLPNSAPLCDTCPLRTSCRAHKLGRETALPFRPAKKKRQIEKKTIFLIHHKDKIVLHKRPATGLLAGLYEYPSAPGWLTRAEALQAVESLGLETLRIRKLPAAKHIFSHKEWHMHGYEIFAGDWTLAGDTLEDHGFFLASPAEIEGVWSIPSAFRVYTDIVMGRG